MSKEIKEKVRKLEDSWNKKQATEQEIVVLLLTLYEELAHTSPDSFAEYWPKSCSAAIRIINSDTLSAYAKGVGHGILAFDSLLKLSISDSKTQAEYAIKNGYDLAKYCEAVCDHIIKKKLEFTQKDIDKLVEEIEAVLLSFYAKDKYITLHQCYLFILHFGLMYNRENLIRKAERYAKKISQDLDKDYGLV